MPTSVYVCVRVRVCVCVRVGVHAELSLFILQIAFAGPKPAQKFRDRRGRQLLPTAELDCGKAPFIPATGLWVTCPLKYVVLTYTTKGQNSHSAELENHANQNRTQQPSLLSPSWGCSLQCFTVWR